MAGCEILHPQEPISINPAGIVCSHEGGEFVIGVKGEKGWSASGMPEWVKVRCGSDLAVIVIEHNESFGRSCRLNFTDDHSSATLEISQESSNMLAVSTDTITADYREGTSSIWNLKDQSFKYIGSGKGERKGGDRKSVV